MVNEDRTNEEIYQYIAKNYGKNQVAVPRQGYTRRLSYGLPFFLIGVISVIALGFAWTWSENNRKDPDRDGNGDTEQKKEKIEQIASEGGPLK